VIGEHDVAAELLAEVGEFREFAFGDAGFDGGTAEFVGEDQAVVEPVLDELAAALKFVSMVDFAFGWQALPRELFLLLWTAIFGLWALYLFGVLRKAVWAPGTVVRVVAGDRGVDATVLAALVA
jgi:hypothetical protein